MKDYHGEKDRTIGWQPLLGGVSAVRRNRSYGIYSSDELRRLLDYERLRAERSGVSVSVVVCHLNGNAGSNHRVRRVVSAVAHTVRETDHIGWVSDTELAVVLPGTTTSEAEGLKAKLVADGLLHGSDVRIDSL